MQVYTVVLGNVGINKDVYPIIAYLVNLNGRYIAIDTGYRLESVYKLEKYSQWIRVDIHGNLDAESGKLGIDIKDIKHVVLTHLHFDHAGSLELFGEGTKFYANEVELQSLPNIDMSIEYHKAYIKEYLDRFVITNDGFDIFGDGSVELVLTPGHTKGHQSVLINDGNGIHLFTGDLFYTCEDFLNRRMSGHIMYKDSYEASVKKIHERLSAFNRKIHVYPAHDKEHLSFDGYEELSRMCKNNGKTF